MNKQDTVDIQIPFSRIIEGRKDGDGDVFAEVYSKDCDFIGFDDTYINGKLQVAKFQGNLSVNLIRGSHTVGNIICILLVTPMVAIVIAVSRTKEYDSTMINPKKNSLQFIIALKFDSKSLFTSFQITWADYMGRPDEIEKLTKEMQVLLSTQFENLKEMVTI